MLRSMPLRWFTSLLLSPGALPAPVKKSPATLPRNFTLPKDPHSSLLRGRISTPPISGSPHLGTLHPHLPPSCIIEELHRALATKHRQERWDPRRDAYQLIIYFILYYLWLITLHFDFRVCCCTVKSSFIPHVHGLLIAVSRQRRVAHL